MNPSPAFRFDRALSVGLAHPLARLFRRAGRVPVLMYHGISRAAGDAHPYYETNTPQELFERHLQFLRKEGYAVLDLDEIAGAVSSDKAGRQVAITFDDGYSNFYTHAFPLLRRYNLKATLFVATGLIGKHRVCHQGREYMSWDEVREVHAHGIRIGSHTVTHPDVRSLTARELEFEISESAATLAGELNQAVRSFSCPYAFPEQDREMVTRMRKLLQRCGFQNGVTTIIGTAGRKHDPYFLPRLPVNAYDDLCLFKTKLEGGYDWLHAPQLLYKALFRRASSIPRTADAVSTS